MRLRVNIRKVKAAVWLLNILAVFCIVLVFITIYKKERSGQFKHRSSEDIRAKLVSEVVDVSRGGDRVVNINRYSALWEARIDGSRKMEETAGPEPDDGLKAANDPVDQVIEVAMIVSTPKAPGESKVLLKYLKEVEERKEMFRDIWNGEGDPLKPPYDEPPCSGKILKIEPAAVTFSWFGKEVELGPKELQSSADRAMSSGSFPQSPEMRFRKPPSETVEFEPGKWAISRSEYQEVNQNYETMLDQVGLVTIRNPETGKKSIKLSSVDEDSIVYKRGFRSGDVLISINGFPVSSKSAAINYLKQHPDDGRYVVEIDRHGRRVTQTFVYNNK